VAREEEEVFEEERDTRWIGGGSHENNSRVKLSQQLQCGAGDEAWSAHFFYELW